MFNIFLEIETSLFLMLTQEAQCSDTWRNFVVGFYGFTINSTILKNYMVVYIITMHFFFAKKHFKHFYFK